MSFLTGAALALTFVAQTDTTIPLQGARILSVEAPGGSIVVRTWERNEVRIQADHSSRSYIEVDRRGDRLDVEAEARMGPATIVDYTITVPPTLNLDLEGMWTRIDVEGSRGEISAETNQGDIRIVGGRGAVRVGAVAGQIHVQGAEGSIEVEAVAGNVRLVDVAGEIAVETVGGYIVFENARARGVEAGTVGGRIVYDGTIEAGGSYFFGSHGGSVTVHIPPGAGAQVSLASIQGSVRADVAGAPARFPRGERTRFQTGNGSATVEVETFGGSIVVTRERPSLGGGGVDRVQLSAPDLRLNH
jgi:hypothetical protein